MPRFDNSASSTRSAPPNRGVKPTRKRPLLADDYLAPLEAVGADNGFVALGVREELAAVLAADNVTEPFPIQTATLPDSIAGRDVLGRGQTGSGKTLAFGLGMLTSLAFRRNDPHQPIGLVMVPTRELAQQVDAVLKPLARQVRLSTQVIAGGLPYAKQLDSLKRAVSILVATPGRLIDLVNKGVLDLSQVQVTVLDEADQMSDMGFMPDMITILDLVKPQGQRMLFSATLDGAVDTLVKRYLDDPIRHEVDSGRATVESMEHHILVVEPKHKDVIISQIGARAGRTIMFARTQLGAERIGAALAQSGVPCGVLHGGMAQRIRTRTLAAFQKMPDAVLVATDVAARGIHVDGISLVVNVDAPTDHKDYLHRAGRTARAGESGTVVTLAFSRQKQAVIGMLARAGVRPTPVFARPMDRDLVKITGAQEPSGEPWISPAVTFQPAPRKGHSTRSFDKPRRPATGGPRRDFDDRSGRSSAPAARRDFDDRPRRDAAAPVPRRDFDDRSGRSSAPAARREFDDRSGRSSAPAARREFDDRSRRDAAAPAPRRDFDDRPRRDAATPRREFGDKPIFGGRDRATSGERSTDRAPRSGSTGRPAAGAGKPRAGRPAAGKPVAGKPRVGRSTDGKPSFGKGSASGRPGAAAGRPGAAAGRPGAAAGRPGGKPTGKPAGRSTGKPGGKPAGRPGAKSAGKPASSRRGDTGRAARG